MKFFKNPLNAAAFAAFLTFVPAVASAADAPARPAAASARQYRVAEVLSGDTFKLESGSIVAYSSIAAPPLKHEDPKIRDYAQKSLEFNRALLQGRNVRVEFGSQIKNAEGYYQGFVFLEDGTFANERVLAEGYAKLNITPPNLQYAEALRKASSHSRRDGKGLWEYENAVDRRFIFVGDQMTKKFHFEGCDALDGLSKAHLVRFDSSVAAKAAGYEFCKECRHQYAQETDLF